MEIKSGYAQIFIRKVNTVFCLILCVSLIIMLA